MRVLLTGMSGTGKSTLVRELRRRGHAAHDADDDGFAEPRADGRWGWRADRVADLLARAPDRLLFFAGCSEEQADLPFDLRVLLTAPEPVLVERLRTRTDNPYGRDERELAQVLADRAEVEPLRRSRARHDRPGGAGRRPAPAADRRAAPGARAGAGCAGG
jgi:broad-specificity NMP kinase